MNEEVKNRQKIIVIGSISIDYDAVIRSFCKDGTSIDTPLAYRNGKSAWQIHKHFQMPRSFLYDKPEPQTFHTLLNLPKWERPGTPGIRRDKPWDDVQKRQREARKITRRNAK